VKLLVSAPPCPNCGPGTMACLFDTTRRAWRAGVGRFVCRRCGFEGVRRVQEQRWVYDPARSEVE
jgi:ribosomal protein S27AE